MTNALAVGHAEQRPQRPIVPVVEIAGYDPHLGRGVGRGPEEQPP